MIFTVELERIRFGYNGSQKDILIHFGLKYRRVSCYKLNEEYDIVFLNSIDSKGWRNNLSKDGSILYESHIDNIEIDINKRQKKRITFIKCNTYDYDGYSFIGVFQLDTDYDWSKDVYPTGKPMDSRVKYNRIDNCFNTNLMY